MSSTAVASVLAGAYAIVMGLIVVVVTSVGHAQAQAAPAGGGLVPGDFSSASESSVDPFAADQSSSAVPSDSLVPDPSSSAADSAPDDGQQVTSPIGLQVVIPTGWDPVPKPDSGVVQASDPDDPSYFVRYGNEPNPGMPLLRAIELAEHTTPTIRDGYRRLALESVSFDGAAQAVNWEFTFDADGVTRHADGMFWRLDGVEYLIYASAPDSEWSTMRPIYQTMLDTVTP
jgi:hypothetical protein